MQNTELLNRMLSPIYFLMVRGYELKKATIIVRPQYDIFHPWISATDMLMYAKETAKFRVSAFASIPVTEAQQSRRESTKGSSITVSISYSHLQM